MIISQVRRWTLAIPALALALALAAPLAASPAVGISATAATPALRVTTYCYANPERTIVKNNKRTAITIRTVGSIYKPYSSEPYYVYTRIGAGKSVTFYTGNGAKASNPKTLTRRYIYNNAVGTREGARVVTTTGLKFTDRCG